MNFLLFFKFWVENSKNWGWFIKNFKNHNLSLFAFFEYHYNGGWGGWWWSFLCVFVYKVEINNKESWLIVPVAEAIDRPIQHGGVAKWLDTTWCNMIEKNMMQRPRIWEKRPRTCKKIDKQLKFREYKDNRV